MYEPVEFEGKKRATNGRQLKKRLLPARPETMNSGWATAGLFSISFTRSGTLRTAHLTCGSQLASCLWNDNQELVTGGAWVCARLLPTAITYMQTLLRAAATCKTLLWQLKKLIISDQVRDQHKGKYIILSYT